MEEYIFIPCFQVNRRGSSIEKGETLLQDLTRQAFRVFNLFSTFVAMTGNILHRIQKHPVEIVILDMSDCYTWSFPEFVPFCPQLYYFSSFKAFKTVAQA